MTATFHVKNFDRFQHYKDRSPPWIKLYNELLDDYEFSRLPDASKWHLIAIWMLASRSENKIPLDPTWVARRINADCEVNLDALLAAGFIVADQSLQETEQDASAALAERLPRGEERRDRAEQKAAPPSMSDTELAEYKKLQSELFEAANISENPSPALLNISPIKALIDKGFSLTGDILPVIRSITARGKTKPTTWAYFVAAITENKTSNGALPAKSTPSQGPPQIWVTEDDPRWTDLCARWKAEKGKPQFARGSRNEAGIGAHFPAEWASTN